MPVHEKKSGLATRVRPARPPSDCNKTVGIKNGNKAKKGIGEKNERGEKKKKIKEKKGDDNSISDGIEANMPRTGISLGGKRCREEQRVGRESVCVSVCVCVCITPAIEREWIDGRANGGNPDRPHRTSSTRTALQYREGGGRNELQVLLLALRFGQTLREWNESQREDEEEGTRGKQTSRRDNIDSIKTKICFFLPPWP
jgi:hypothetical protein